MLIIFLPFLAAILKRFLSKFVNYDWTAYDLDLTNFIDGTNLTQMDNVHFETLRKIFKLKKANGEKWGSPFWYLPFFQIVHHILLYKAIIKAVRELTQAKKEFAPIKQDRQRKERAGEAIDRAMADAYNDNRKKVKEAENQLAKLEIESLKTKMMEAVFESGPQFILQLSIVIKLGYVETFQAVTIVVSFVSFWFSMTKIYLAMPTKKTSLRDHTLPDYVIVMIPILFLVLARLSAWVLIVSYLEELALAVMVGGLLIMVLAMLNTIDFRCDLEMFGIFASILVPCIVKDEYGRFYWHTSLMSSLTPLLALPFTLLVDYRYQICASNLEPPIFSCFHYDNYTSRRCRLYNATTCDITDDCTGKWIRVNPDTPGDVYRTVCQSESDNPLIYVVALVSASIVISILISWLVLHLYLDPLRKLRLSSKISFMSPLWNENYETSSERILSVIHNQRKSVSKTEYASLMYSAIRDNIDSLVERLLTLKRTEEARNDFITRKDFLEEASISGNSNICTMLLRSLKKLTLSMENSRSKAIKSVLKRIQATDHNNFSVLHYALRNHNHRTCQTILDYYDELYKELKASGTETDIDTTLSTLNFLETIDMFGHTLFHHATKVGNINAFTYLLKKHQTLTGQNDQSKELVVNKTLTFLERTDNEGDTILHTAANSENEKTFPMVLKEHYKLSLTLTYLLIKDKKLARYEAHIRSMQLLIKDNKEGDTVIHKSGENDNHKTFAMVLSSYKKGDLTQNLDWMLWPPRLHPELILQFLEQKNHNGENILHKANKNLTLLYLILQAHMQMCGIAFESPVDQLRRHLLFLEEKDSNGRRLVHKTATSQSLDVFQFLMNYHKRIARWMDQAMDLKDSDKVGLKRSLVFLQSVTDKRPETAAFLAAHGRNVDFCNAVMDMTMSMTGGKNLFLHSAILPDDKYTVQWLLETFPTKLSLNETDENGNSLLHITAKWGRLDTLKLLTETMEQTGVPYDIAQTNLDGQSLMHLALKWGNTSIAKWICGNYTNSVKELYRIDSKGKTPLDLVIAEGLVHVVQQASLMELEWIVKLCGHENINTRMQSGYSRYSKFYTLLHAVVMGRDIRKLHYLVDIFGARNFDPEETAFFKVTPLMMAVGIPNQEICNEFTSSLLDTFGAAKCGLLKRTFDRKTVFQLANENQQMPMELKDRLWMEAKEAHNLSESDIEALLIEK